MSGYQFRTDFEMPKLKAFETVYDHTHPNQVFLFKDKCSMLPACFVNNQRMHKTKVQGIRALYCENEQTMQNEIAVNLCAFMTENDLIDEKVLDRIVSHLTQLKNLANRKKRVHLLGMGDVGATLSIGLKLLGGDCIETLGIYDLNPAQAQRWEMELNQIVVNPKLKIESIGADNLLDCDVFIFCASKYVPAVGEVVKDVRLVQYAANAEIVGHYARLARNKNFQGLFFVVSDPVDLLCKKALEVSNKNEEGLIDHHGLKPEQIRGYGLGVMDGRAHYYADKLGYAYIEDGRVFGPHGADLVVADSIKAYNAVNSIALTERVITSNLEMRAIGYKPFVAPAISSGANAIVETLQGKWHYSATYINGMFWGTRNRWNTLGTAYEENTLPDSLISRIEDSFNNLEAVWQALNS